MKQLEPTYRDALVTSWKFILHHKLLWILGAMAMLIGQFGLGNFLGSLWTFITEGEVALMPWIPDQVSWAELTPLSTWQFAGLFVMMFALFAFIAVMAVCAQGAVIAAAVRFFSGRKTNLATAWHTGARHFWRLLAVNSVQQIILLFTISAMLGFWRDFSHTEASGIIMLVIGLALGLFIALLTSVLSIYTAAFVVDKEYTLSEAVAAAYELFKDHILVSFEVSLFLLLLTIVPVLAIAVMTYLVIIPALPFWLIGIFSETSGVFIAGTALAQVLFAVSVALIGGAFNAFTIATWMYCYRHMDKKGISSRLEHHVKKVFVRETKRRTRVVRGRVS